MAHLRKLKTGFQVRWRNGGRGSPVLNSVAYTTKAAALAAKADIEAKVAAKQMARPHAVLPIAEIIERWAASRVNHGNDPGWTELTRSRLQRFVAKALWGTTIDITPAVIEHWRSGAYNARMGALLRALLRWAKEHLEQPVDDRVLVSLRPPRQRQTRRALMMDDSVAAILAEALDVGQGVHALIHCLTTYGWRPISAAKLRVADVDLGAGKVTLRELKGGGDDLTHPISAKTLDLLRPLIDGQTPDSPLFRHPATGLGWTIHGSGSIPPWYRKWQHAQIYDLKRWAISRMLERGLPPQEVALFTGHKTISQVLRYAQTNEWKARAALQRFAV